MTPLGIFIRKLLLDKGDIKQGTLAKELGCSPSQLSNILAGKSKSTFNIELLIKCIKYFKLDKDKTIELFDCAFSSAKEIVIEPKYLSDDRQDMLKGILTTLFLYQDIKVYSEEYIRIQEAANFIRDTIRKEGTKIDLPKARS